MKSLRISFGAVGMAISLQKPLKLIMGFNVYNKVYDEVKNKVNTHVLHQVNNTLINWLKNER